MVTTEFKNNAQSLKVHTILKEVQRPLKLLGHPLPPLPDAINWTTDIDF